MKKKMFHKNLINQWINQWIIQWIILIECLKYQLLKNQIKIYFLIEKTVFPMHENWGRAA